MLTIGAKIKAIQKQHNLNQIDFSHLMGISQERLSEIEQDKTKPSADTLMELKVKLNVDLNWLLTDKYIIETDKQIIVKTLLKELSFNKAKEESVYF
jgi:transcriptional regulator with XRE-family HTH domain